MFFSDTSGRPAFIGSFPYALVQRCHLVDAADGTHKTTTASGGKKPATHPAVSTVVSVARLRIPVQLTEAYPLTRTALNKAFEADHKFKVTGDDEDDDDDNDDDEKDVLFILLSVIK